MRLLQLANQQLIPIYALNQTNLAANIGILQHSAQVLSDVQNAVGAGLEVVIPATAQTNGTWSGSGYIMLDPQTGAADYRISGGVSGNVSDDCNRSSKTIAVASLNVSIIWWLLLGWMVDDNDDFNGVAVATVLAAVVAVAIIIVVAAPAAAAVGGLVARAGAVISEAALTGALVAFSGAALANGGDTCSCTPMGLGYRRGGNAAHNACAAQPQNTDPPFAAEDVELGGKAFDGWLQSQNKLTEVKTGLFYTTIKNLSTKVPAKQAFLDVLLAKNVAEFYVDRVKSGFCNIDFGFAVTDGNLLNDMRGVLSTTGDAGRVYNNGC
jgi:hypothetical protein